jgi:hypothetical protein
MTAAVLIKNKDYYGTSTPEMCSALDCNWRGAVQAQR